MRPVASVRTAPDHPRIRGEHMSIGKYSLKSSGSSPHTRGARRIPPRFDGRGGIIPAYAGSTWAGCLVQGVSWDHPRIRGEHGQGREEVLFALGSSPHTRGARAVLVGRGSGAGIIPAYAGSTPPHPTAPSSTPDHPRIRGEHPARSAVVMVVSGSSPHTRGAPCRCSWSLLHTGIIPAYAGSTTGPAPRRPRRGDHPRIRGEHASTSAGLRKFSGSSPHTRGALPAVFSSCACGGIIPAYAGSTRLRAFADTRRRDHPRIRGEHCPFPGALLPWTGSSPHTRGAPTPMRLGSCSRGIIPAYAGSTPCRARW